MEVNIYRLRLNRIILSILFDQMLTSLGNMVLGKKTILDLFELLLRELCSLGGAWFIFSFHWWIFKVALFFTKHSCWEHTGRCAQLCFSRWTLRSGLLGHGVFSILIHTAKLPFRSTILIFALISSVSSRFLRPQALYCLPIWWMKKMGTQICSFLIFILQTLVKLNVFSYVSQPILCELFVSFSLFFS